MTPTRQFNRHQAAALLDSRRFDAEARAIWRDLGASGDEESQRDLIAHAQRLAADSLTIRETIGHADPLAYSTSPSRRLRAVWQGATRHTLALLADDRSRRVRLAVASEQDRRERDLVMPHAPWIFDGPRDPMDFVVG